MTTTSFNTRQIGVIARTRTQRANNPDLGRQILPKMITTRGSNNEDPIEFEFLFPPQQIQYSNMSPEMSEISRPGRSPLIAFTRFRAKQISFRFLLAIPLDGLFTTVDNYIQALEIMANTARPIYFTNLDRQISNPLNIGDELRIFWTITDLNFNSIRRNERNEIVAAEANITLVENNNPIISASDLPVITYTDQPPNSNPKPSSGNKKSGMTEIPWSENEAATAPGLGT